MSRTALPLATLLGIVPYFHSRGAVRVDEAAADLGTTPERLRSALWQLWSCGLPGYGPGELIDLAFSAEDLDEADMVEVTFTAGIERPVRLTASEAVTLETGLAVFLDHPEVVDQAALRELMEILRGAAVSGTPPGGGAGDAEGTDPDAETLRRAVHDGRCVRFVYHSASSDTSTVRVVDPARLSLADGHAYLHGVDRATGSWRTFRTDRMSGVEDLGPRRELGPEPQSDPDGAPRIAEAVVPAGAEWFLDEFPFDGVTRRDDGDLAVRVAYHDEAWLRRFLLGHADLVRPVDPALRADLAARARRALDRGPR